MDKRRVKMEIGIERNRVCYKVVQKVSTSKPNLIKIKLKLED